MLRSRITATAVLAASLALPATALAQSAGDNQYQDPLAGQSSKHHSTSGSSHNTSSGTTAQSSSSGSSSSGTSGTSGASTSTSSSSASAAASGRQLPRTGFELLLPLELGLAMLLTGLTLQRVLTLRDRRR